LEQEEKTMEHASHLIGLFALSSAISCHFISRSHLRVDRNWITNKWFWAGLFGNLPAMLAFFVHVHFERQKEG